MSSERLESAEDRLFGSELLVAQKYLFSHIDPDVPIAEVREISWVFHGPVRMLDG